MSKTRHIQARMAQRAINQKLLNLTLEFGIEAHNGKVILNRKGLAKLIEQLKVLQETAQKAVSKGGLVVVREGDRLITTYQLKSYRRGVCKAASNQEAVCGV